MAAPTTRVEVKGLGEFTRALRRADAGMAAAWRLEVTNAGQAVAAEATRRFSPFNARSASGYRPRVRAAGYVVVEQRIRRTTGEHPEWGVLQMRTALIPALWSQRDEVLRRMEAALDGIGKQNGF